MNHESPANPANEWAALLMSLFLFLGCALLFLLTGGLLLLGLTSFSIKNNGEPLSMLIFSASTLGLGLLLLPGAVLNLRKFFNRQDPHPGSLIRMGDRILIPAIIIAWPVSLAFGHVATGNVWTAAILLPAINILAIGLPVLLYVRISLHGLELPSARRGWSIFGASILTAPLLAIIFEAIALGVILLAFMVYASTVPGLTNSLNTLVDAFRYGSPSEDEITRLAAGLVFAPGAAISLLLTFSLAIPLIEETLKVIVIWFYLGRIRRPVDGFVLGIFCGAAFALTESLGFSSAGSADWAASVAARATAALPHILNSGLFGWALVSAWKEARYGRLAGTFLAIILIHGTWNAISLGIALSEFSTYVADVPLLLQHSYPWYAAWVLLALGSLGGLIFNNRQMRKQIANEQIEKLGYNSRLLSQTSGEDDNGMDHKPD